MNMETSMHAVVGGHLLAPTLPKVQTRGRNFLLSCGARIDEEAANANPLLAECLVAPGADFVLAMTSCGRPLVLPEAELIAQLTGRHMALLRFDAGRGASFDIRRKESSQWLCHYLAWRRRDGDLWLIPSTTDGVFIRVTASGPEYEEAPPFSSAWERYAGIIRAIDNPSFEGSL
jgi:hypothetical protein